MSEKRGVDNDTLLREVCKRLSEGKRVKLRAKGDSMRPFIHNGDILVIVPVTDFRKGDIVLAHIEEGRYVIHRIIGLTDTRFTLKGDGNLYGKEYCSRKDVFGMVASVIHNGRERNLLTKESRIKAYCWHFLLPIRRLRQRIMNLKNY